MTTHWKDVIVSEEVQQDIFSRLSTELPSLQEVISDWNKNHDAKWVELHQAKEFEDADTLLDEFGDFFQIHITHPSLTDNSKYVEECKQRLLQCLYLYLKRDLKKALPTTLLKTIERVFENEHIDATQNTCQVFQQIMNTAQNSESRRMLYLLTSAGQQKKYAK